MKHKILFISEAATLAHKARPLVLARSLDTTRYDVHFASSNDYDFVFSKEETFKRWNIYSQPTANFLKNVSEGKRLFSEKTLHKYIESDLEIIESIKPDLIVGDLRVSLAVSAPYKKIPYISISNAYWSPYLKDKTIPVPVYPFTRNMPMVLMKPIFNLLSPIVFSMHAYPLNKLRKHFGLSPFSSFRDGFTSGDFTLYADVPSLIPTKTLPSTHRFIGPIIWSPDTIEASQFISNAPKECLAYVTVGSSGQHNLIPIVLDALSKFDQPILLATAGKSPVNSKNNIYQAPFIPGELACKRSRIVICNGGSTTAYQALRSGVPVIGICSNLDQFLAMRGIIDAGAGILIREDNCSSELLLSAISNILSNNSYSNSAKQLSIEFNKMNCFQYFSSILEEVFPIREKHSTQLRNLA